MPDYELTINGQTYDVTANSEADLPAIARHIAGQSQPQQPAVPSPYAEQVPGAMQPIEFQGRPPEQVGATLGDFVPPPELAADLLKIKSPEGGMPTQANVEAIASQIERTGSIRDVLNKEVASGALSPTTTLDPQQYPVLAPIWEQYKQEMEPSMAGAAARGAMSQVGPAVGGLAGGAIGSIAGGGGALPGAIIGSLAGGAVQEAALSGMRTPQEQTAAQAQAAFDEARARGSRAVGEAIPQLATLKPAIGTIERAFAGDASAIAQVAIGSVIGGAIPAATGAGAERVAVGAITGGALEPRQLTGRLMQRPIRTEQAAQQAAGRMVQQYATQAGGVPEQLAQRITEAAPRLSVGGVQPLVGEISGNEGLISLGNALSNMNAGLRQIRAQSREALSRNVGEALQQQGATFEQAEQFLAQQRNQLLTEAQAAYENFIRTGDTEAAGILSESLSRIGTTRQTLQGVAETAEQVLDRTLGALETARAKLSARGGVKDQASVAVKGVLNQQRNLEKEQVNKLYNDVKVAGLKSKAQNTYQAALDAKGSKGAGLWGDLPDPIQKIITTLKPPEKGAAPEVTVQDLMSGIRTLNGKIRASSDPAEQRLLTMVKDGMDADIQALGKVHSDLAVANAAYASYASRYKDRAAKGVFNKFGGTEDSRTIDAFLNGPIESVRQLKDAVKGDPAATQSIQDWIVNDLASSVKDTATPTKINAWLSKRNVEGWLKEFPEALPTINAYLGEVTTATEAVSAAESALRGAKSQLRMTGAGAVERQQAGIVRDAARRQATAMLRERRAQIENSAAEKVIGSSPVNAVMSVMESKNPQGTAKELMALAAQDSSGNATKGIQNAVRQWMGQEGARFGEVVSTLEDPTKTISIDDLSKSFSKLNQMLTKGTDTRNAIETVLGKNSKELNMLDLYRGQLEVMERFRRAAQGQSVTSLNQALKQEFEDKMANNLLGVLGGIAYNALPLGMKGGATGAAIRGMSELASKTLSWSGDPSGRVRALLVEAQTDPELMAKLLRPLNKDTLPQAKMLIKTYLVAQPQQESK